MHVDSIRSTRLPIASALRRRRIRYLPFAVVATIGLLAAGNVAAQDATQPGPTQTQDVAPMEQPAAQAKRGKKDNKVCHYEDVTGSRMKKRVCFTPEQWEARAKAAKDFMRELDDKPLGREDREG
ncbi:hypothetical protein OK348_12615 [Flavobacterium sp. MXW15]|uniref:Uncharacterized protein n=1 Tax=Xanthomonas chitinilytica TaxID=2989819 RepID=A0ABT3JWM5_9XANT|nr:hypothetical protein [Xanthomonas sp. H13-6]MCW4455627.1 hypothetical protein [Flavobacterium sp. MXW15]MCW4472887.1 hypothetical protein [Xanthomonas sp. H13-6]